MRNGKQDGGIVVARIRPKHPLEDQRDQFDEEALR